MSSPSSRDHETDPVPDGTCAVCRKPVTAEQALDAEADMHAGCVEKLLVEVFGPR